MKARSTFNNLPLKVVLVALLLMVASIAGVYYINQNSRVDAVKAADFKDGNIISDYVFYNKDSMTAQQIQGFLNGLIPTCLTWNNTTFVDGGGTRVGPPFVCLNNYYENPDTGETSFEKGGGAFAGGISAAQIIYNASQQYGINPQVLLVMLKKESLGPLTADNWPTKWQYRYAMGYACPDSGPNNSANCNDKQAGFYKQVNLAAWQFKYYKEHPNDYRYALGWNNIQYSPDASCGTKRVYIENIATLSLYIYTPYTPNAAALANYPGTANCGAYGNRNFFMFFSEWFGSTEGLQIKGSIKVKYDNTNGVQTLGIPIYNEKTDGKGTWWQCFENGCIIGNRLTGYWESKGSIRSKWAELGYQNGPLGMPISGETYNSAHGNWEQSFEGGKIVTYNDGTSKYSLKGSIYTAYNSYAKELFYLPSSDEKTDGKGTWWQKFGDNEAIIGNRLTGYWESKGSIRSKWAELGYQNGPLGMPIGHEQSTAESCYSQEYENGTISGCRGKYTYELREASSSFKTNS